jgi:tetratricopeptide (TPR) repeat protein
MPANQMYDDSLDSFTDRELIVHAFEHMLRSNQAGRFRVFAIKGNSGAGKTFLISYLSKRICPKFGWEAGQISFTQSGVPGFRAIVAALESALQGCVPRESLKQYRDKRDEYNRRFDGYRDSITSHQSVQIDSQLLEREMQLRSELSGALTELAEASTRSLCVFIDGCERLIETSQELASWLFNELLPGLAAVIPQSFIVMICGWEWSTGAAIAPFTEYTELTNFDLTQVKSYLEKQEVIPNAIEPAPSEHEKLLSAFYDLTKGHPLVLGLAVTYFNELSSGQRIAESLQTKRPLLDDKARVEFLAERLLSQLPEPHRTLLERGPILRSFDKTSLQALLSVEIEGATNEISKLDERTYERFLYYPFINRESPSGGSFLLVQLTFHDLLRGVRLEALRRYLPEAKEQLHRKMADYYWQIVKAEQELEDDHEVSTPYKSSMGDISRDAYSEGLVEIPEQEFKAWVEYFYHALQVRDLQADAFKAWEALIGQATNQWRGGQVGSLLELVQQVAEEGEPFLSKTSAHYGHYLVWYSRYLEQGADWEGALGTLKQAARVFEQAGDPTDIAGALNNIGYIYQRQGELEEALSYYELTLTFDEQVGNPASMATTLNNIGYVYDSQGKLEQALSYYERALPLYEQAGDPTDIAGALNNIIYVYNSLGESESVLSYYERALAIYEQLGDSESIATTLNNIGYIYNSQGELENALSYYERALPLYEQLGNPTSIGTTLNNIGYVYQQQGKVEQAIEYLNRALNLYERLWSGFEADVAEELEILAACYDALGNPEKSSAYTMRAHYILKKIQFTS